MAKTFTCTNCGSPVQESDERCPECGVLFIEEEESKEDKLSERIRTEDTPSYVRQNHTDDIEDTISFFLLWAKVVNIVWVVVAVLIAFSGMIIGFSMGDEGVGVFFVGLVIAAICVIMGAISERSFKWKAYMLKTNYKKDKK